MEEQTQVLSHRRSEHWRSKESKAEDCKSQVSHREEKTWRTRTAASETVIMCPPFLPVLDFQVNQFMSIIAWEQEQMIFAKCNG